MNIVIVKVSVLMCVHFVSLSCVFAQLGMCELLVIGGRGSKGSCCPRESAWSLIAFYFFVSVSVLRQSLLGIHYVAQAALKFMVIFMSPVSTRIYRTVSTIPDHQSFYH